MSNKSKNERRPAIPPLGDLVSQRSIQTTSTTQGPIPSGAELQRYESVMPGAADRIFKMAETNQTHRHAIEAKVVDGNVTSQARGQLFAFILSLVIVAAGGVLLYLGKTSTGLWLILGDVSVIATVFIGGKLIQRKERAERRADGGG